GGKGRGSMSGKSARTLDRPLAAVAGCVLAAWVFAFAALGAPGARADQARPVIDVDFLYHQLYYMSSNFLYRVSGEDGDPRNPSDPANQPPQLNGWQEFYAYWKKTMTDEGQMGPLGPDATVADHDFQSQG